MAQRFEYDRMDGSTFAAWLKSIDMSHETFARITGSRLDRVEYWLADDPRQPIPTWVSILLPLLALPGAIHLAKRNAAAIISRDNLRPERGAYPYLQERQDED